MNSQSRQMLSTQARTYRSVPCRPLEQMHSTKALPEQLTSVLLAFVKTKVLTTGDTNSLSDTALKLSCGVRRSKGTKYRMSRAMRIQPV